MCITDIIEFITDYEFIKSCNNTGVYYYKNESDIEHFSYYLCYYLQAELYEKFKLVSSSKTMVEAIIYGRFHTIELIEEEPKNYSWIVTMGSDDD